MKSSIETVGGFTRPRGPARSGSATLSRAAALFRAAALRRSAVVIAILTPMLLFQSGCAAPAPALEQGPDAELTHDGLVRVNRSRMQRAWVRPGTDLSRYSKMVIGPPVFRFKRGSGRGDRMASGRDGFAISDASRAQLEKEVSEVFREELAKSKHFERVEAPGPGVILLEGALLDIVSFVPPQTAGRDDIYLDRVGEATIVLQVADSETGQVLARAAERRAIQQQAGMGVQVSNVVTTWADVRTTARRWARILREQLDAMYELGPIGEPAATN